MAIEVLIPNRLQRSRALGWRKPARSVIVDRTSRWGNPWGVVLDPDTRLWRVCRAKTDRPVGRGHHRRSQAVDAAVERFRRYLTMVPRGRALAARSVSELSGKNLVCWCSPGATCHADVLLRTARGDSP